MDKVEFISPETEYGKKLIDKFGEDVGREVIDFIRENGITIRIPVVLPELTLSVAPHIKITFMDGKGEPIKPRQPEESEPLGEVCRAHRWILEMNGEPQLLLKSVQIPKLDYTETELLTLDLTYYAIAGETIRYPDGS